MYALSCPCGRAFEISTGAGRSSAHGSWHFEQFVCTACQTLQSVVVAGDAAALPSCRACTGQTTRWQGFAGIRRTPDDRFVEHVDGPCPRCGQPLEADETGLWD